MLVKLTIKAGCGNASSFDDPHNVNTTHGSGEQAWLRYHLLPSSITFETSQGVVGVVINSSDSLDSS